MKKCDLLDHHKPITIVQDYLLKVLLLAILALACVSIGSKIQFISARYLLFVAAAGAAWLFYAANTRIDLKSSLFIMALFLIQPHEATFYFILGLLAFILIAELVAKDKLSMIVPYPAALVILLGFGLFSASKISNPAGFTYFVSSVILPLLALVLFRNARIDDSSLLKWIKYIIGVATFVAAYGIVVAIRNPFDRIGSFWITAMTINGFYLVGFFFAVAMAIRNNDKLRRAMYGIAGTIILLGMLYTYTRMAILAVAFGIFLFMIRMKQMRLLGIIILGLMPLIIPSSMISRIELGFQNDISLVIRAVAWYFAVKQIILHPLTGMGFSVWADWYRTAMPIKMMYAQHTHNVYLNLMVEMGIVGTLAYFSIIYGILRKYWQMRVKDNEDIIHFGMWVAMMSLLFACLTDIFIQQYSISILFWVCMGLMMANSKEKVKI